MSYSPWTNLGHATVSVRDLRVLTVGGDIPILSDLFDAVRFQALETANVHVSGYLQRLSDNVALLGAFYGAVSSSRLQNLDLALLGLGSPPHKYAFPALRDVLAPILPLSDLRSFNLIGMLEFAMVDDADIEALARAWPKLERLHIDRGSTRASDVSITALHRLSVGCPSLTELLVPGLRYPTIGVHEIPSPPPDRSPSHPLRHLRVRTMWFPNECLPCISDRDAEALAWYLLDLFPRLDGWKYEPAPPHDNPPAPQSSLQPSRRLAFESVMSTDNRWWKVARRIYAICSAREGM